MSSGVDRDTVISWSEQAQTTLQEAKKMCTRAQALLQSTTYQLVTQLPERLQFVTFMVDAVKQQHELLTSIVESQSRIRKESVSQFNVQVERDLTPALAELDDILAQLAKTKVPSYLINNVVHELEVHIDTLVEDRNLCDFISMDDIKLLTTNIEIYKANCTKLHGLLEKTMNESVMEPYQIIASKKYHNIMKQYKELMPVQLGMNLAPDVSPYKLNNLINTILKENSSLEHELVPMLEMMTNHYDQCVQGTLFFNTKNPKDPLGDVNFEVLRNDALELPDVLKELNTVYDIIVNNEVRTKKLLSSEFSRIDSLISMIKDLLEFYTDYKATHLSKYMILVLSCDEIFSKCSIPMNSNQTPLEAYIETITLLLYHYTQFLSIYKSEYLTELFYEQYTYPRKYLAKLTDFLNNDMFHLQQEEYERRKNWLARCGEFIPNEFKLPGELNQPSIIQVVTEGLDDVQKDYNDGKFNESAEEINLSDLIKTMKL